MARYTFKCEHFDYNNFTGKEEGVSSTHTLEFRADSLTAMLEQYEMFLRGAGFYFDGNLDIVDDSQWSEMSEEEVEQDNSRERWAATVHSLMNPPSFRANGSVCETCGLNKEMMQRHNCYDDNCPVHAPKAKIAEGV